MVSTELYYTKNVSTTSVTTRILNIFVEVRSFTKDCLQNLLDLKVMKLRSSEGFSHRFSPKILNLC